MGCKTLETNNDMSPGVSPQSLTVCLLINTAVFMRVHVAGDYIIQVCRGLIQSLRVNTRGEGRTVTHPDICDENT